jgi:hypothetical protein
VTIILGAFTFRSWKSTDSLHSALEVLRRLYTLPGSGSCQQRYQPAQKHRGETVQKITQ